MLLPINDRARDFGWNNSPSPDAVRGLCAIAEKLDANDLKHFHASTGLADVLAIALGWVLLVGIICYPGLQLIGMALCACSLAIRPFGRLILGARPRDPSLFSNRNRSFSAA